MKKLFLVFLFALIAVTGLSSKPVHAQATRNIYGYVKTPTNAVSDILEIKIYDLTTGFVHWADGMYYWAPAAMTRYYKNNLPTNHAYRVEVTLSFSYNKRWQDFFLPTGYFNDQKIANIVFNDDEGR